MAILLPSLAFLPKWQKSTCMDASVACSKPASWYLQKHPYQFYQEHNIKNHSDVTYLRCSAYIFSMFFCTCSSLVALTLRSFPTSSYVSIVSYCSGSNICVHCSLDAPGSDVLHIDGNQNGKRSVFPIWEPPGALDRPKDVYCFITLNSSPAFRSRLQGLVGLP